MGIIIKDQSPLVSFILTEYGKKQLAIGKMSFDYYAFGDSDIDYRTSDINSLILKPVSEVSDLKYLLYKKDSSAFYPITSENIEPSETISEHINECNIFSNTKH